MPRKKRDAIDLEEFDRRLDASNAQKQLELDRQEAKLAQVEQLLTYYENALDEIEAGMKSVEKTLAYPAALRKRLTELAAKTTEMAASL